MADDSELDTLKETSLSHDGSLWIHFDLHEIPDVEDLQDFDTEELVEWYKKDALERELLIHLENLEDLESLRDAVEEAIDEKRKWEEDSDEG